jgi:hypothetical protein
MSEEKGNNSSAMDLSKMSQKAQMKHGVDSADVQCLKALNL